MEDRIYGVLSMLLLEGSENVQAWPLETPSRAWYLLDTLLQVAVVQECGEESRLAKYIRSRRS